jgi:hypothetical protein
MTADQAATAIREVQHAMPHDLSMLCAVLAAKINENGALSDLCRKSVIEQLDEIADEIDADFSQQMEQAK